VLCRDAKLSVVEWNAELHCLKNNSLHSFEGDPALREACPGASSLGAGGSCGWQRQWAGLVRLKDPVEDWPLPLYGHL